MYKSLTDLANHHASDKGTIGPSKRWPVHNYTDVYDAYLHPLRGKELTILEIGLGVTGNNWHSAIVHGRNTGGLTALHAAAYGGHVDVVRWLIGRGARVNDSENFYRMTPLHAAAEEDRKPVVELLLAAGAVVEAQERNGYSPLTQAGWREYWETAGVLMSAGATCQPADLVGDWLYAECTKRQ